MTEMGDVNEADRHFFEICPGDWPAELVWARKGGVDPEAPVYAGLFVVPPVHVAGGTAPPACVRVMRREGYRTQTYDFVLDETVCAQILRALGGVPASLFWTVCGVAMVSSLGLIAPLIIGWLS